MKNLLSNSIFTAVLWTIYFLSISTNAAADRNSEHILYDQRVFSGDTAISILISKTLSPTVVKPELIFPASVKRFYADRNNQPVWVLPLQENQLTWEGMLLIDCVLQFGLDHNDYHPREMSYTLLHKILEQPNQVSQQVKARFDVMLTDALVALINHLHYGKMNPDMPASRIDKEERAQFRAEQILKNAVARKNMALIGDVQPKTKQYWFLQENMRLITMQYTGDCYEMPEGDVQQMAINMERLRWMSTADSIYIQINVPSYTLELVQPDTTYSFKVIVGKPQSPTPTLLSAISHFTTAPEWKVPKRIFIKEILPKIIGDTAYLENNHMAIYDKEGFYLKPDASKLKLILKEPERYYAKQSAGCDNALGKIVFRFPNQFSVYLHDTPQPYLFKKEKRALSHGCIRVERAEDLAALLLRISGSAEKTAAMHRAVNQEKTKDFYLKKPVPIKIAYLTCEYKDGILVKYPDIYDLDKRLGMAMYGKESLITSRSTLK